MSENTNTNTQKEAPQNTTPIGTVEIIAISGIFLTVILGYCAKILWDRRTRFTNACDIFSSTFENIIQTLETSPQSDRDILSSEFPIHEKAMIKFKWHLKGKKLDRFNKAWDRYKQHHKERTDVPLLAFLGTEVDDLSKAHDPNHIKEVDERNKNKTLQCIKEILSFTKLKI